MKTVSFRSVYRMKGALSTDVQGVKKAGFLLIELMIALAMLAVCSLLVARLQVHMIYQYHEAEQYLKAVNYASRAFEERLVGTQERESYTIAMMMHSVQEGLPYKQLVVMVSWKTGRGVSKSITMYGGMLDENETA